MTSIKFEQTPRVHKIVLDDLSDSDLFNLKECIRKGIDRYDANDNIRTIYTELYRYVEQIHD